MSGEFSISWRCADGAKAGLFYHLIRDRAFAIADRADHTRFFWRYYSPLVLRSTTAMRVDSRFLPMMEKLGFVDHWKQTKIRPDVCLSPEEREIALCLALVR